MKRARCPTVCHILDVSGAREGPVVERPDDSIRIQACRSGSLPSRLAPFASFLSRPSTGTIDRRFHERSIDSLAWPLIHEDHGTIASE